MSLVVKAEPIFIVLVIVLTIIAKRIFIVPPIEPSGRAKKILLCLVVKAKRFFIVLVIVLTIRAKMSFIVPLIEPSGRGKMIFIVPSIRVIG